MENKLVWYNIMIVCVDQPQSYQKLADCRQYICSAMCSAPIDSNRGLKRTGLACTCAAAGHAEPHLRQVCACRYDAAQHAFVASIGSEQLLLDPATVRRNDTSAKSINEWTGEKMSRDSDIPEDITPESVAALGNYAVQILWQDGFNQVSCAGLWCGSLRWVMLRSEQVQSCP